MSGRLRVGREASFVLEQIDGFEMASDAQMNLLLESGA